MCELLITMPPDNHWNREQIFARPELTSATIERFYPRAIEWGKQLNYTILANIATHSNTPRHVLKDLAMRNDVPVGGVIPAQKQMQTWANELLTGTRAASPDDINELYEYAVQTPSSGPVPGGKPSIIQFAKSPRTPTNILAKVATYDDRWVQTAVVANSNSSAFVLTTLSKSHFPEVRALVAANPSTPWDTVQNMMEDTDPHVRATLAANPKTPPDVLTRFAKDRDYDELKNLARNPNTPREVLVELTGNYYVYIQQEAKTALMNRSAGEKVAGKLQPGARPVDQPPARLTE